MNIKQYLNSVCLGLFFYLSFLKHFCIIHLENLKIFTFTIIDAPNETPAHLINMLISVYIGIKILEDKDIGYWFKKELVNIGHRWF